MVLVQSKGTREAGENDTLPGQGSHVRSEWTTKPTTKMPEQRASGVSSGLHCHFTATTSKYLHTDCIRLTLHQRERTCSNCRKSFVIKQVRETGVEPARVSPLDPKCRNFTFLLHRTCRTFVWQLLIRQHRTTIWHCCWLVIGWALDVPKCVRSVSGFWRHARACDLAAATQSYLTNCWRHSPFAASAFYSAFSVAAIRVRRRSRRRMETGDAKL
jgi:hypothetical protein